MTAQPQSRFRHGLWCNTSHRILHLAGTDGTFNEKETNKKYLHYKCVLRKTAAWNKYNKHEKINIPRSNKKIAALTDGRAKQGCTRFHLVLDIMNCYQTYTKTFEFKMALLALSCGIVHTRPESMAVSWNKSQPSASHGMLVQRHSHYTRLMSYVSSTSS